MSFPEGTEKAHRVRQIEHHGDEITRKIFEQLDESLITPLEPEEIARLAPVLDDVLDRLDWVTHQLCNYEIPEDERCAQGILVSHHAREHRDQPCSKEPLYAKRSRGRQDPCGRRSAGRITSRSELLSRAVLDLFKTKDLLLIIKLKDIYEGMAKVMEKCNDVGHALSDIAKAHS